ncbi:MAG TPA: DUF4142 domain-containing protein [Burkholderiaceae bacterium]|jgi:putative membrane protein
MLIAALALALTNGLASAATLDRTDAEFLEQAARADRGEIEGCQLALKQSHRAEVKALAQQILTEHQQTAQELATLAASKGLKLPEEPTLTQATKLKALSLARREFDVKFVKSVGVDAYAEEERLYFKASTESRDAEVRAFAARTLPIVERRLDAAQKLLLALDKDV